MQIFNFTFEFLSVYYYFLINLLNSWYTLYVHYTSYLKHNFLTLS